MDAYVARQKKARAHLEKVRRAIACAEREYYEWTARNILCEIGSLVLELQRAGVDDDLPVVPAPLLRKLLADPVCVGGEAALRYFNVALKHLGVPLADVRLVPTRRFRRQLRAAAAAAEKRDTMR
jgi:hypothetical protein